MAHLPDRTIVRLSGPDAKAFLQGLVSNDVQRLTPERPVYAALLTPQGKYLFDFVLFEAEGAVLVDAEAARAGDLVRRLMLYRLRAQVDIEDIGDRFGVVVGPEADALRSIQPFVAAPDPRLAELGARGIAPRSAALEVLAGAAPTWDTHRLRLGVPLPPHDLVVDRSLLLESGFEELNGVDFGKGCYVGQELTARTKYRGLTKKRLVPVQIQDYGKSSACGDGPCPPPGTLLHREGREAGEMRSSRDGLGLALLRLDALRDGTRPIQDVAFQADQAVLRPVPPTWLVPALSVSPEP